MITLRVSLVAVLVLGTACNDRLAQLEKENKELRAGLAQQRQIVDLDTQAKCASAAKQYFQEEFPPDRSTILLDHHSHYNKALGKCFVLSEWHYNDTASKTGSWYNMIKLTDAYQRDEYGNFSQFTDIMFEPTPKSEVSVITCEVNGTKCKSIDQFSQLTSPFMSN